jgi:hypothetical protein
MSRLSNKNVGGDIVERIRSRHTIPEETSEELYTSPDKRRSSKIIPEESSGEESESGIPLYEGTTAQPQFTEASESEFEPAPSSPIMRKSGKKSPKYRERSPSKVKSSDIVNLLEGSGFNNLKDVFTPGPVHYVKGTNTQGYLAYIEIDVKEGKHQHKTDLVESPGEIFPTSIREKCSRNMSGACGVAMECPSGLSIAHNYKLKGNLYSHFSHSGASHMTDFLLGRTYDACPIVKYSEVRDNCDHCNNIIRDCYVNIRNSLLEDSEVGVANTLEKLEELNKNFVCFRNNFCMIKNCIKDDLICLEEKLKNECSNVCERDNVLFNISLRNMMIRKFVSDSLLVGDLCRIFDDMLHLLERIYCTHEAFNESCGMELSKGCEDDVLINKILDNC